MEYMGQALVMEYPWVLNAALVILAVMAVLCLLRAVIGPTIADRLVAVNMLGTMVMVMISILAVKMQEGYLVDICLIYAMISFLAVVVLTKVYTGVYLEKKDQEQKRQEMKTAAGEKEQTALPEDTTEGEEQHGNS